MNKIGVAPNQKSDLQPKFSMKNTPESAAATPPTAKPEYIITKKNERYFAGEYSVVNAEADGTIPPMPSPAKKRYIANNSGVGAKAVSTIMMDMSAIEAMMIVFLPILSQRMPPIEEPKNMPSNA